MKQIKGYYVLGEGAGRAARNIVSRGTVALGKKLDRGLWMDIFKKWVGKERPTHVPVIDWAKVSDLHREGHSPRQAATHYLNSLEPRLKEAYAPAHTKLVGSFTEKEHKKQFDYSHHDDEWAHKHGLPHLIHFNGNEHRYGHVKGTVAYVATDENALGMPVLDRWEISKHHKFQTEEKITPARKTLVVRKAKPEYDPLDPKGSYKHQEKELKSWQERHKWKIRAAIAAAGAGLGAAALYDKAHNLGPWSPDQNNESHDVRLMNKKTGKVIARLPVKAAQKKVKKMKNIVISYTKLGVGQHEKSPSLKRSTYRFNLQKEDVGTDVNTPKKNKEKVGIERKDDSKGIKAGKVDITHGPTMSDTKAEPSPGKPGKIKVNNSVPTTDDPEADDRRIQDNPENAVTQQKDNPHYGNTHDGTREKERLDQVQMGQKPNAAQDNQGFDNSQAKAANDNRSEEEKDKESQDGEGGKKLSKSAQKVKDIYNKKRGENGNNGSKEQEQQQVDQNGKPIENEADSTEDEPTGEGETINFNPTIDNITTQATGL